MKGFSTIPHTADLQIHVEGSSLKELFRNALIGMFQSIKPDVPGCGYEGEILKCDKLPQQRQIDLQAHDINSLLVDFLSEALYFSDLHNEAYLEVEIKYIDEGRISAMLHGIKVGGFENEIKAVTYHGLNVEKKNDIWQVDIVFDI